MKILFLPSTTYKLITWEIKCILQKIKEYCIILVYCLWGRGANSKKGCFWRKKFLGESQDFAWHREFFGEKWGNKVMFSKRFEIFRPKRLCQNSRFLGGYLFKHGSAQTAFITAVTPIVKNRYMCHPSSYFRLSYQLVSTLLSRHIACCLWCRKTWSDFVVYTWWQGPCVFPT